MPWVPAGDQTGLYHIVIGGLSFSTKQEGIKNFLQAHPKGPVEVDYCEIDSIGGGWLRLQGKDKYFKAYDALQGAYLDGKCICASGRNETEWLMLREKSAPKNIDRARTPSSQPLPSLRSTCFTFAPPMSFRPQPSALVTSLPPAPMMQSEMPRRSSLIVVTTYTNPPHLHPRFLPPPVAYAPLYPVSQNMAYQLPPPPQAPRHITRPAPAPAPAPAIATGPLGQPASATSRAPPQPQAQPQQLRSSPRDHLARPNAASDESRPMTPKVADGSSPKRS